MHVNRVQQTIQLCSHLLNYREISIAQSWCFRRFIEQLNTYVNLLFLNINAKRRMLDFLEKYSVQINSIKYHSINHALFQLAGCHWRCLFSLHKTNLSIILFSTWWILGEVSPWIHIQYVYSMHIYFTIIFFFNSFVVFQL